MQASGMESKRSRDTRWVTINGYIIAEEAEHPLPRNMIKTNAIEEAVSHDMRRPNTLRSEIPNTSPRRSNQNNQEDHFLQMAPTLLMTLESL